MVVLLGAPSLQKSQGWGFSILNFWPYFSLPDISEIKSPTL